LGGGGGLHVYLWQMFCCQRANRGGVGRWLCVRNDWWSLPWVRVVGSTADCRTSMPLESSFKWVAP